MSSGTVTIADIKGEVEAPAIIVDHQGYITFVNRSFEAAFGWQSANIVGEPVATIIPPAMHDAHNLGFSRFVTTGEANILNQPLKLTAINRAGEVFEAEHFIVAEQQNDEWVIGATIRPLTQHNFRKI
jgi:PAS domain S-box-containing protein